MFTAECRMPGHVTRKDREERVNQVIETLGLTAVADSYVGDELVRGISTGERKVGIMPLCFRFYRLLRRRQTHLYFCLNSVWKLVLSLSLGQKA